MTDLESAVIHRMLSDPECTPNRRAIDPSNPLEVEERSIGEVGVLTTFVRNEAAKLFDDDISMRWGKVWGRLNSAVDVDFVVYVDKGYVTGVECVTFGGEPWPYLITEFTLAEITGC